MDFTLTSFNCQEWELDYNNYKTQNKPLKVFKAFPKP